MTKNLKITICFGAIVLMSFSFLGEKTPFLNFSTEDRLIETMENLSDFTSVIANMGKNYLVKTNNQSLRTATGSTLTHTTSYCYSNLGMTISYVTTSNVIPNEDFTEVITISQYKNLFVNLDSTSEVGVYGYTLNESTFGEVIRDSVTGKWLELMNVDEHYFSYVSKYVSFNSAMFTPAQIDSLHLDYEATEAMNSYFEDKRINSIQIRDSDSFFYRIMH